MNLPSIKDVSHHPKMLQSESTQALREWMDGYTLPGRGCIYTSVTHPLWIYKPCALEKVFHHYLLLKQQYVSLLCACSSYLTGLQNTKSIKNTIQFLIIFLTLSVTLQNKLCLYYVLKLLFFLIIQCLLTTYVCAFLNPFYTHYLPVC